MSAAAPGGWRSLARSLGWWAIWLPGALIGLLLAGGVALWLWAASPGSLPQALGWAGRWMQDHNAAWGQLQSDGAQGSLRGGGRIQTLRWTQGDLSVQAEGVQLVWSDALWLDALGGRGLHIPTLTLERLLINDQRAPTPTEPPTSLTLPLPVSLGFSVERLDLTGNQTFSATGIRSQYRYGPVAPTDDGAAPALAVPAPAGDAHHLLLTAGQWADGRYKARLRLGAEAPLALALALQGEVLAPGPDGQRWPLRADAQASGSLAGRDAALDLNAQVKATEGAPQPLRGDTRLVLSARVMPWADQPLLSADAQAQALNLAALWPDAPQTALSGRLQARPEGALWRATLQLDNALVGPWDRQGLPLQSLQAEVERDGEQWRVPRLAARLADGALQGQAAFRLAPGATGLAALSHWEGALTASGLRPARLWSTLAPGALDAKLSAQEAAVSAKTGRTGAIDLVAEVKPSAVQPPGTALAGLRGSGFQAKARWLPDNPLVPAGLAGLLDLSALRLEADGARLEGSARLHTLRRDLDGQLTLSLPGAQLDWKGRAAAASGSGDASLQLDSAAQALDWARSLQNLPWLAPAAREALAPLAGLRAEGKGQARLSWQGGLGALGWPGPAPSDASAAPPAQPSLQATISLPRLSVRPAGDDLATVFSDLALQALGPLNALDIRASGGASQAPWQAQFDSAARWRSARPGQGELDLSRLQLRLTGAAQGAGWLLQNSGPLQLTVGRDAHAGLALDGGAGELQLSPLPGARLAATALPAPTTPLTLGWQRLLWQAGSLDTQGRLQGLSLAWLEALAALGPGQPLLAPNGLSGDLVFDGAWDLRLPAETGAPLRLAASLQRRSGDLRWVGQGAGGASAPLTAGVRDARLSLAVQDRQVQAQLRWDTERLGQASADLSTPLAGGGAAGDSLLERWWPASSPLRGTAQVRLPQVGVWSLLAPPGWRMQGTVSADARLSGTRGAPEWRGNLQADELALQSVVDGIAFTQGQLRATLVGERIRVDRLSLQGPGGAASGGTLEASGQAEWRAVPGSALQQPFIELQAKAQRLRLSSRPDRRLVLSGDLSATLSGNQFQLRGALKADSALFILPDETTPSLGDDVVVRSTRDLPAKADSAQRVQPDVSVALDLGPQFEVSGQGLQTRLEGQLTVRATPKQPTPRVLGEVRAVNGTYRAYDQTLKIEAGVLRFTGPYDDPALDIRAIRVLPEKTDQRVGVQISGNAQAPRVALFSDPELPDGDKLAWLILGRPASAAGAQAFVLQQAARRLLSRGGEPLDSTLARSLGLDDIGFSSSAQSADGTTTAAALTLGKRLSSDLYLTYEQSLSGAMSTVSILYDLSRRFTLRARAGTENAIDLIFTQRYD